MTLVTQNMVTYCSFEELKMRTRHRGPRRNLEVEHSVHATAPLLYKGYFFLIYRHLYVRRLVQTSDLVNTLVMVETGNS